MKARLTLVGEQELPDHLISDTLAALRHVGWLGITEQAAEVNGLQVLHIRGMVPPVTLNHEGHDHDALVRDLLGGWQSLGIAAGLAHGPIADQPPALVVMDVDSTLIPVEVIERIAAHAGVEAEVEAITTAAMRGELEFSESLVRRVRMLEGVSQSVLAELGESIPFSPGALELIDAAHHAGATVGVVSGGFHEIVDALVARSGVDLAIANRLEVAGGTLTGATIGEIVDGKVKERTLGEWRAQFGGPTAAIGDGANDLGMVKAADLGLAYCAKPILAKAADAAIPFPRLDAAIALLGL